jgi:hypothetical protein
MNRRAFLYFANALLLGVLTAEFGEGELKGISSHLSPRMPVTDQTIDDEPSWEEIPDYGNLGPIPEFLRKLPD